MIPVSVYLQAVQPGALDLAQDALRASAESFMAPLATYVRSTWLVLAIIEVVLTGYGLAMARNMTAAVTDAMLRLYVMGFLLVIVTGAPFWLPPLVAFFAVAPELSHAIAVPPGPSEVLSLYVRLAFETLNFSDIPIGLRSIHTSVIAIVGQVFVLIAGGASAIALFEAWWASYVAITASVVPLALGASRFGAAYAENALNHLVCCGLRLMVLYLVLASGHVALTSMANSVHANPGAARMQQTIVVVVIACAVGRAVWSMPSAFAHAITRTSSFGIVPAMQGRHGA